MGATLSLNSSLLRGTAPESVHAHICKQRSLDWNVIVILKFGLLTHHKEKIPTACTLLMPLHMNLSRIGHTQFHTSPRYKPLSSPSQHLPCPDNNLNTLHPLQDEGPRHCRQLKGGVIFILISSKRENKVHSLPPQRMPASSE